MSSSLSWPKDDKDATAGPGERPVQVRVAVVLMYAGAAIAAIQPIWWLLMPRTGKEEFADRALKAAKQDVTPETIATHIDQLTTLILVTGVITIGLWILMGLMNNRGKRWARMTATMLAVANLIFTFTAQPSLHGMALVVVGVVSAGLLWMSRSRDWFNGGAGAGRPMKV
jgi:hypothetical protein